MRGKSRPFVVYRRGPGYFTIVPRGLLGWAQFAGWLALMALLIWWFVDYARTHASGRDYLYGVVLFAFGLAAWFIGGLWWMLAHAERIDVSEMLRDRQLERRKRRRERSGRRGE